MSQLELHTTADPLADIVVDICTQGVTVGAATLLPTATVVGITDAETGGRLVITTRECQAVVAAPGDILLQEILIVGPHTGTVGC